MRAPRPSAQLKAGALAIIVITMWLGGFGCSFCCATGVTKACCLGSQGLPGKVFSSEESCASDSCCKPSGVNSETPSGETVSSPAGVRGCSLLPAQQTSLFAEQRISGEMALAGDVASPPVELVSYAHPKAFIYPPTPRNRGATYLRCCVLLI